MYFLSKGSGIDDGSLGGSHTGSICMNSLTSPLDGHSSVQIASERTRNLDTDMFEAPGRPSSGGGERDFGILSRFRKRRRRDPHSRRSRDSHQAPSQRSVFVSVPPTEARVRSSRESHLPPEFQPPRPGGSSPRCEPVPIAGSGSSRQKPQVSNISGRSQLSSTETIGLPGSEIRGGRVRQAARG